MNVEALGSAIAAFNATLNLTSAILLIIGFRLIRRGRIEQHRRCMIGAVSASGLFLVLYVVRFSLTGTHAFAGPDGVRRVYLAILFSHMILAVVIVPLVVRLLFLAGQRRFEAHRRLARWTFPAWLYTSVTGLLVYLALYHLYG